MTVSLLPDAERVVTTFLRAQSEVTSLVSTRVWTEISSNPTIPFLRVRRVSGAPAFNYPLYLDQPLIQIEGYASNKATARAVTETARACLAARLVGTQAAGGVVAKVSFGAMSWLPDEDFTPPQPRYIADVTVHLHQ